MDETLGGPPGVSGCVAAAPPGVCGVCGIWEKKFTMNITMFTS